MPAFSNGRRTARRIGIGVLILSFAVIGTALGSSSTANTTVAATVVSATSLDATGCATGTANVTDFGTVYPSDTRVTSSDCVLAWGSNNDTSMLRVYQRDGSGTAFGTTSGTFATQGTLDNLHQYAVSAYDSNTAYSAGAAGQVSVTTNGGTGWTITTMPGFTSDLNGISVAPLAAATAFVVGASGKVFKTTDTGVTWGAQASGTASTLRAVSAVDINTAFVVGSSGTVIKTINGGTNWTTATSAGAGTLNGVSAASTVVVFAVDSSGTIYRSGDAAVTWSSTSACPGSWKSVSAIDASNAYVVGSDGNIAKANWNGTTLTCATQAWSQFENLVSVAAAPGTSTAFAVGQSGTVIKTVNGGTTWIKQSAASGADLRGVSAVSSSVVWATGRGRNVVRSIDGSTWTLVNQETVDSTTYSHVSNVDGTTAYLVGGQVNRSGSYYGAIRKTTNGGSTWTTYTSNTPYGLLGVKATSAAAAFAVGDGGTFVRTSDGSTWATVSTGTTNRLWSIDVAPDGTTMWAVGDSGTIINSTNGGSSWNSQASGTAYELRGVVAISATVAFAVGDQGTVLRTVNGGSSWSTLTGVGSTSHFTDVAATDSDHLMIAGAYDKVIMTTNGSAGTPTWTLRTVGATENTLGITMGTANIAWTSTMFGLIYRTTDGGVTWTQQTTPAPVQNIDLYDIDAVDANTAWAVGSGSAIVVETTSGGANAVADYAAGLQDWAQGTNMFGACLRSVSGTGVTGTWTTNTCAQVDTAGYWNPIPATSASAGSKIAASPTSGTNGATASLRFGFRASTNQPPGIYTASMTFEVVAPNV